MKNLKQLHLTQKAIDEWVENPVTAALLELIRERRENIEAFSGVQAYTPFEPQKTQELIATIAGQLDGLETAAEALEGDWSTLVDDEDAEEDGEREWH